MAPALLPRAKTGLPIYCGLATAAGGGGGGGFSFFLSFFFACENSGRMLDYLFSGCAFFFFF